MTQPMTVRPYQQQAIAAVRAHHGNGARSVLLVSPTGSGKTFMGAQLVAGKRSLWVGHREELVTQAARELSAVHGPENVGVIMAGPSTRPAARIQVGTIQTLLSRGAPDVIELVVLDEAHHYVAPVYSELLRAYPDAAVLGLTATPERQDGTPLGDIFQEMVVAAQHSQLLADGHIVPVKVYRPTTYLGSDLAQDPVSALIACAPGLQAFGFFARVDIAAEHTRRWKHRGITAETIDGETNKSWRKDAIELFRSGRIRVLNSVHALTEGVDVPAASAAVLARAFCFPGTMLQATGRVIRTAPHKTHAVIIDLCGCTNRHGLPTDDRLYSLKGRAISTRAPVESSAAVEFSQSVRNMALEVVTTESMAEAEQPELPINGRTFVDMAKVKSIRAKHGSSIAKSAFNYLQRLGE